MSNSSSYDSSAITTGSSCSYATLSTMNQPWAGNIVPVTNIVPAYGGVGYDNITNSQPTCSGYFNMSNAYGSNSSSCSTPYYVNSCKK